jgi:hypothetical protein
MNRRGFLGRIGAVGAAVVAVQAEIWNPTTKTTAPLTAENIARYHVCDSQGNCFLHIRATQALKRGDFVTESGAPLTTAHFSRLAGVAMADFKPGDYGFIRTRGVTTVNVAH